MSKNKVKFKYGAGSPPSTISNGTLLFNYTEGKVFFDIEGERYDLNTASRVDVNTEEVNEYRPIVTTKDNLLYSVDHVPMCNFYTGELKAKTFTGTLNGAASDLSGHNESSLESFNFRASAGERSIKDDFANVKAIYGNSVV